MVKNVVCARRFATGMHAAAHNHSTLREGNVLTDLGLDVPTGIRNGGTEINLVQISRSVGVFFSIRRDCPYLPDCYAGQLVGVLSKIASLISSNSIRKFNLTNKMGLDVFQTLKPPPPNSRRKKRPQGPFHLV